MNRRQRESGEREPLAIECAWRIRSARRAWWAAALASVAALGGCQSPQSAESRGFGFGPNLEARLVATGGATLTGVAMLHARDGGLTMTVSFTGAPPGSYRIAVHENGNCTSPNGFSAGPPWAPPGVAVDVATVLKSDDSAQLVVRLPGYRLEGPDGVQGRAVVVHAGAQGSLEAQPGVPNNRVGCGVIGTPRSLLPPRST